MPSRVLATLVTVGILACGCASTAGAEGHRGGSGSGRTVPGGSPATPDATPSEAVAAAAAIAGFRTEVDAAAAGFVGDVDRLQSAVDQGSLLAARSDELAAQADFDRFRLLQTGDATTASTLDELATDVGAGQTFGGLHAVERDLWTPGLTPAAATADAATDLSGLVAQAPVAEYLLAREVLDPEAIGTTAVSELGWVDGTAIPGREEQYSHLDGVDIAATVSAAHDAFGDIEPLGHQVAPTLTASVASSFDRLEAEVARLGPPATVVDGDISPATRLGLSQQVDATAAVLARLAALLVPFGTAGPPS
jgi:iron uptake system EfeUOB component EfeO/EfeM